MLKMLVAISLLFALTAGAAGAGEKEPGEKPPGNQADLLVRPDFFKTLVNPQCSHCVDESKRRGKDLRDDDRVLAWTRGKYDGGAVPLRFFLAPYRVISDTYGVWVYDADAGFLRGYEPSLDFTFHGWRNGIMVIRHKDGTLFSALSGVAFDGPRKGERLMPLATIPSDWGYWLKAYPRTVAYNMFEKYQPVDLPAKENAESVGTRGKADTRLPADDEVLGVWLDGKAKAYPLASLEKAGGVVADRIGGQDVVILWHKPTHAAAAYSTEVEGADPARRLSLSPDPARTDAPFLDENGSHFGVEGRAVDGPLKGKTLRWLDSVQCKWFAWAAEYPHTEIQQDGKKAPAPAQPRQSNRTKSGVIVEPATVTGEQVARWKEEGVTAVAVLLDEGHTPEAYAAASKVLADASVELYYWVEVGRNPAMAGEHPRWVASLGMHDDWRARFHDFRKPGEGEVAKAFPWVPITYREAFDAHLVRVKNLLRGRAAGPYAGVLLNDLQGGPSSCGCGNLQCRWATDYRVPSTATKREGEDPAARFAAAVRAVAAGKAVVPVWTTECEDIDLPEKSAPGGRSTGLCGVVECAKTTCPKAFARQWAALLDGYEGPVGVLALGHELERDAAHGQPGSFAPRAVAYLDAVPAKEGGTGIEHERLWLVIQGDGLSAPEQVASRRAAEKLGVGAVFQSLVAIPQSYEPRLLTTSTPRTTW